MNYKNLMVVLFQYCKFLHHSEILVSLGALLQKIDRDTQKCAYKCCFAVINDNPVSLALSGKISVHSIRRIRK